MVGHCLRFRNIWCASSSSRAPAPPDFQLLQSSRAPASQDFKICLFACDRQDKSVNVVLSFLYFLVAFGQKKRIREFRWCRIKKQKFTERQNETCIYNCSLLNTELKRLNSISCCFWCRSSASPWACTPNPCVSATSFLN